METVFPDLPGVSGALLLGWRRRPGSAVSGDNIQQVFSVIVKRAYRVSASASDPGLGFLQPRADGPEIFEEDQPGNICENGDFADGLAGWSVTGGASASVTDGVATVTRSGGGGDLRRSAGFGRQLRGRGFALSVEAQAGAGLANPGPRLVAGGATLALANDPAIFADGQPVLLSAAGRWGAGVASQSVSIRLPAMGADGQEVRYGKVMVTTVEYETDLVPFKPQADLIVICDAPPLPIDIAVAGTVRMSQQALPQELTGLAWEDRMDTPREGEGGDFTAMTQPLPDAFQNSYYNGHRRDRRQGGSVPYPQPGQAVAITREGGGLYAFTLPATGPGLRHEWLRGGQDDPALWHRRGVAMALDTLVIEPDRNHAYAVWRAAWPVDLDPDGGGPIPLGDNRRATVLWEDG